MAKQTINLGTGELTGDGESIRQPLIKLTATLTNCMQRMRQTLTVAITA
jgi:hypothetical protein